MMPLSSRWRMMALNTMFTPLTIPAIAAGSVIVFSLRVVDSEQNNHTRSCGSLSPISGPHALRRLSFPCSCRCQDRRLFDGTWPLRVEQTSPAPASDPYPPAAHQSGPGLASSYSASRERGADDPSREGIDPVNPQSAELYEASLFRGRRRPDSP